MKIKEKKKKIWKNRLKKTVAAFIIGGTLISGGLFTYNKLMVENKITAVSKEKKEEKKKEEIEKARVRTVYYDNKKREYVAKFEIEDKEIHVYSKHSKDQVEISVETIDKFGNRIKAKINIGAELKDFEPGLPSLFRLLKFSDKERIILIPESTENIKYPLIELNLKTGKTKLQTIDVFGLETNIIDHVYEEKNDRYFIFLKEKMILDTLWITVIEVNRNFKAEKIQRIMGVDVFDALRELETWDIIDNAKIGVRLIKRETIEEKIPRVIQLIPPSFFRIKSKNMPKGFYFPLNDYKSNPSATDEKER